jgi:hypothetical protein
LATPAKVRWPGDGAQTAARRAFLERGVGLDRRAAGRGVDDPEWHENGPDSLGGGTRRGRHDASGRSQNGVSASSVSPVNWINAVAESLSEVRIGIEPIRERLRSTGCHPETDPGTEQDRERRHE